MPTTETAAGAVIERRTIHPTRSVPLIGRKELTVPKAYRVHQFGTGASRVGADVTARGGEILASDVPVTFWLVSRGPFELFLPVEDVIRDSAGHGWNLHLDVAVTVLDPARLLIEDVLVHVDEHRPLTPEGLGRWLQERLPLWMKLRLEGAPDAALRERHGRPIEAWQAEVTELLAPWGLGAVLKARPEWTSPTREAAELRRKAEEARVVAEKAAAEARRVAEEQRQNEAAQQAIREKLVSARKQMDEARAARAAEEAATKTQRLKAEASALEARERNARMVAEREAAQHRLQLAEYERMIRQKELEQAELANDAKLVEVRRQQKAEAEARMKAAEAEIAAVRDKLGVLAAAMAELLAHAAAQGAGAEELTRTVRSLDVLIQQGDQRMTERFNQLDGQLQVYFQSMERSIDGGIDERRAILERLTEFFTELGKQDSRMREALQPALASLGNIERTLEARFDEVRDRILENQALLQTLIQAGLGRTNEEVRQVHAKVDAVNAKLDAMLGQRPKAEAGAVGGKSILYKYLEPTPQSGAVRFRKSNMQKRDVGGLTRDFGGKKIGQPAVPPRQTGVQMDCVRLGDPVDLQIVSPIAGHLTLVNIGTTRRNWLISPHRYMGGLHPLVAGKTYEIPGPELFSREKLWLDGYESVGAAGEEGEEGFVAWVTPTPLIDHQDPRLIPHDLFWEVPDSLLKDLDAAYAALPEGRKAVGTLRYLIIPRGQ